MPRQPRIDYPGAWQHITNRGRNQQAIFRDEADYSRFLQLLARSAAHHSLEVAAFALMTNHFHLLVRSRTGDMSSGMQLQGGRYTQEFNEKYGADGALFKGRFFSKVIDDETYLLEAFRYIVNNPVKARIVARPEEYPWSSYAATIGLAPPLAFLQPAGVVEDHFDNNLLQLQRFVAGRDSERSRLYGHTIRSARPEQLLSQSMTSAAAALERFDNLAPPSSSSASLKRRITAYVCDATAVEFLAVLLPFDNASRMARSLLITLLRRSQCVSAVELATTFDLSSKAITTALERLERSAATDTKVRALIDGGLAQMQRTA